MKKTNTRQPSKKEKNTAQGTGCFSLIVLLFLLTAGFLILRALDTPEFSGWATTMTDNPYQPEDFVTLDGYVTCTVGPTRRGLDVSSYQEDIDWARVRAEGFDFAFIRIGYRGYSVGNIFPDERARENLAEAKAAGFDVGVYFYAQAISPEEAAEEARWCLDFLAGESLQLPVVYDWEWVSTDARTGAMNKDTLTACAKTFCEAVESGGYKSMIYFNNHIARDLLNLEQLAEYPFWLAQYKDQLDFPHRVDF